MGCDVASSHGVVELFVEPDAGVESIKKAVEDFVIRNGTFECGIAGWDMRLTAAREHPDGAKEVAHGVSAMIFAQEK